MNHSPAHIQKLVYASLCLALALVLPFLTGQIPEIGSMLCPMHIPVLLCGFLCGWPWGLAVGAAAPILRSVIFSMPPMYPTAVGMMFELAAYGFLSGLLCRIAPKKIWGVYIVLIVSMIFGRAVWGVAQTILLTAKGNSFTFAAFIAGAITKAVPGIIVQLLLIPPVVLVLSKAGYAPNFNR
ncbi:MAG: ECF transporter S component [Clostridia bacterium]|nr:ECF transporter S component [Clostridia bacterium]